jgi:hypothetical protein
VIQSMTTPLGYLEVEVGGGSPDSPEPARIEARLRGKPISRERAREIAAGMQDGSLRREPRTPNRFRQEVDRLYFDARDRFGLDAGELVVKAYMAGSSNPMRVSLREWRPLMDAERRGA